jgi:hypothetical protein
MIFKVQIFIEKNTKKPDSRCRTIISDTFYGENKGIIIITIVIKINKQLNITGLDIGTIAK